MTGFQGDRLGCPLVLSLKVQGLLKLGGGLGDIGISGTLASSSNRLSQAHWVNTHSFSIFQSSPRACPGIAAKWLIAMGGEALAPPEEVRPEREDHVDQRGSGGNYFFLSFLEAVQLLRPAGRGEGKGKRIFCHLVTFLPHAPWRPNAPKPSQPSRQTKTSSGKFPRPYSPK